MSGLSFESKGDWSKTEKFLAYLHRGKLSVSLESFGQRGVAALQAATPVQSGLTAASWSYEVKMGPFSSEIVWKNGNVVNGVPIAIILQYGHGTGTGGYVAGRDYINPALRPVFDEIANQVWKEVTSQ